MNRPGVRPSRAQKGSPKSKAPVDWVRAGRMRLAVAEADKNVRAPENSSWNCMILRYCTLVAQHAVNRW